MSAKSFKAGSMVAFSEIIGLYAGGTAPQNLSRNSSLTVPEFVAEARKYASSIKNLHPNDGYSQMVAAAILAAADHAESVISE